MYTHKLYKTYPDESVLRRTYVIREEKEQCIPIYIYKLFSGRFSEGGKRENNDYKT